MRSPGKGRRQAGELRAAALRPDAPLLERPLVDALDAVRPGHVGRLAVDLAADEPHDGLQRVVLGPHQGQRRLAAEVALPHAGDPVWVGQLDRAVPQPLEQVAEADRQPAHDRVREGDSPLETGRAHELDGLVDRRVPGDAGQVGELVGTGAERGAHGRIELRDRAAGERLDAVVERADALLSRKAICWANPRSRGSSAAAAVANARSA